MAHTPRKENEKRPHPALYTCGVTVGVHTEDGPVFGVVSSHDEGGWIYVDWGSHRKVLPGYLRATQVFRKES